MFPNNQLKHELDCYQQELTNLQNANLNPTDFKRERDALAKKYGPRLLEIIEAASSAERYSCILAVTTSLNKTLVTFDWSFLSKLALYIWELPNEFKQHPQNIMDRLMYAAIGKKPKDAKLSLLMALQYLFLHRLSPYQSDVHPSVKKIVIDSVEENEASLPQALDTLYKALKNNQEKNNFITLAQTLSQSFDKNTNIKNAILNFFTDQSSIDDILQFIEKNQPNIHDKILILERLIKKDVLINDSTQLAKILSILKDDLEKDYLIIAKNDDVIKYYSYVLFNLCLLHYKYVDHDFSIIVKTTIDYFNNYLVQKGIFQTLLNQYCGEHAGIEQLIIASRYANAFRYSNAEGVNYSLLEKRIVAHPLWRQQIIVSTHESKLLFAIKQDLLNHLKEYFVSFKDNQYLFIYQMDGVLEINIQGELFVFDIECDGSSHSDEMAKNRDALRDSVLSKHGVNVIRVDYQGKNKAKQYVTLKVLNTILTKKYNINSIHILLSTKSNFTDKEINNIIKGALRHIKYQMIMDLNDSLFQKEMSDSPALLALHQALYKLNKEFKKMMGKFSMTQFSDEGALFNELESLYSAMTGLHKAIYPLEQFYLGQQGTQALLTQKSFIGAQTIPTPTLTKEDPCATSAFMF